jgi:hypothetical protein
MNLREYINQLRLAVVSAQHLADSHLAAVQLTLNDIDCRDIVVA